MLRRVMVCLLMLVMLTGCWSRVELNDLGVALGMGVDQGQNAPVRLTLFIARSTGGGVGASKASGSPSWTVAREAENVADAMRQIALASPRRITLHHLRVVVVGEDYARAGVGELFDFVARHPQIRLTSRPIVVHGTAEEALLAPPRLEALEPESLAEQIQAKGGTEQRFKDVLIGRVSTMQSSWMHAARVVNSQPGGEAIQLSGVGVFYRDRLVVWLEPREAQAVFWLLNNPRESVISSPCPDDPSRTFSVEVEQGRTDPIPQLNGNQISFRLQANARVNMVRSDCAQSLVTPESRRRLEIQLERDVADRLDDAIRELQSGKADPLGFGRRVQQTYPALWRRIEDEWPDIWSRTPVHYAVTVAIHHAGLLIDPINRTRGTVPMETP